MVAWAAASTSALAALTVASVSVGGANSQAAKARSARARRTGVRKGGVKRMWVRISPSRATCLGRRANGFPAITVQVFGTLTLYAPIVSSPVIVIPYLKRPPYASCLVGLRGAGIDVSNPKTCPWQPRTLALLAFSRPEPSPVLQGHVDVVRALAPALRTDCLNPVHVLHSRRARCSRRPSTRSSGAARRCRPPRTACR